MLILVTGSRGWKHSATIELALKSIAKGYGVERPVVMHGGAPRGADLMTELVCKKRLGWDTIVCKADWDTYGKSAGHIRNGEMVARKPDICLAFLAGNTPGTLDCIAQAEAAGIEVIKFRA